MCPLYLSLLVIIWDWFLNKHHRFFFFFGSIAVFHLLLLGRVLISVIGRQICGSLLIWFVTPTFQGCMPKAVTGDTQRFAKMTAIIDGVIFLFAILTDENLASSGG